MNPSIEQLLTLFQEQLKGDGYDADAIESAFRVCTWDQPPLTSALDVLMCLQQLVRRLHSTRLVEVTA